MSSTGHVSEKPYGVKLLSANSTPNVIRMAGSMALPSFLVSAEARVEQVHARRDQQHRPISRQVSEIENMQGVQQQQASQQHQDDPGHRSRVGTSFQGQQA